MKTLKVNHNVTKEINNIRQNAELLVGAFNPVDTGEITGCPATKEFEAHISAIDQLLSLYTSLILKDMREIKQYVALVKMMDTLLS